MSRIQFENIVTKRLCTGLRVPSGETVEVPKGSMVQITQALGSSYTINYKGNLIRVDGQDADALGKEALHYTFHCDGGADVNEDDVWQVLRSVYDPEIPVNIVDLGLVYGCEVRHLEDGLHRVDVTMTLTAPACGMGPVLVGEVEKKLLSVPHVDEAKVQLTFDPPWDRSKLSDAAKLHLGLI